MAAHLEHRPHDPGRAVVLKFQFSDAFMEMFRVVIQLGAILAVVVLYFHKLWPFCADNGETTALRGTSAGR